MKNYRNDDLREIILLNQTQKMLRAPLYFPAISSITSRHNVRNLLAMLLKAEYPLLLISAYDFYYNFSFSRTLINSIQRYLKRKNVLFLDSGGFESYWNNDKEWSFERYTDVVNRVKPDLYSSFDVDAAKVIPMNSQSESFESIVRSGAILAEREYLPIFHGETPAKLVNVVKSFLKRYPTGVRYIAVAERECGFTLKERTRTISQIVKDIAENGDGQHLHLLGCGQPLSMALYSSLGVKTFDSRDWMRSTFDEEKLILRDFSHLELLSCKCVVCKKIKDPLQKTIFHNLRAYLAHMEKIRDNLGKGTLNEMLLENGISNDLLRANS